MGKLGSSKGRFILRVSLLTSALPQAQTVPYLCRDINSSSLSTSWQWLQAVVIKDPSRHRGRTHPTPCMLHCILLQQHLPLWITITHDAHSSLHRHPFTDGELLDGSAQSSSDLALKRYPPILRVVPFKKQYSGRRMHVNSSRAEKCAEAGTLLVEASLRFMKHPSGSLKYLSFDLLGPLRSIAFELLQNRFPCP